MRVAAASLAGVAAPRVLVAHDDASAADGLRALLSAEGFVVATVGVGDETLRVAASEPPDIVLLDLTRSPAAGAEVARSLRADRRTRATIIIGLGMPASRAGMA